MNQLNYQKELDKILEGIHQMPSDSSTLLLHSCCAPCSSYVLKYLRNYFKITVFYYNPNISYEAEYKKRVEEQKRLIREYNELPGNRITVIEGDYEPNLFLDVTKPYADCKEGGERCFLCYELRLKKTAELAQKLNTDYFTTTLTISPLKNAQKLNEIGLKLADQYHITWLPSDFKKRDGYKQSIELSAQYNLYRQDYCGCVYSKLVREAERTGNRGQMLESKLSNS